CPPRFGYFSVPCRSSQNPADRAKRRAVALLRRLDFLERRLCTADYRVVLEITVTWRRDIDPHRLSQDNRVSIARPAPVAKSELETGNQQMFVNAEDVGKGHRVLHF